MSDSDAPNPYAVTTLEIGAPVRDPSVPVSTSVRWMIYSGLPLMVFGVVLAFIDIETIPISGPVMLGWGAIMVFLTRRDKQFRWFAWACCGFPIVVFLVILLMSWSPEDAQHPISILCALFTAAMIFFTMATFHLGITGTPTEQISPRGSSLKSSHRQPDGLPRL